MRRSCALLIAVLCGACFSNDITICDRTGVYGIRIDVRDSASAVPYAGPVNVRAVDGVFSDSVAGFLPFESRTDSAIVYLVMERPGAYRVYVEAPSYLLWEKPNVVVTENGCHVNPVTVSAKLRKAP